MSQLLEYFDALDEARHGRSKHEWRQLATERARTIDRMLNERHEYYDALEGALALLRLVSYDQIMDRYYLSPDQVLLENSKARFVWECLKEERETA